MGSDNSDRGGDRGGALGLPWTLRQLPAHQPAVGDDPEGWSAPELIGYKRPWLIEADLGIAGEAEALVSPGEIGVFLGRRPVVLVYALKGLRPGAASHQQIAEAIVASVNFVGATPLPGGDLAGLLKEISSAELGRSKLLLDNTMLKAAPKAQAARKRSVSTGRSTA